MLGVQGSQSKCPLHLMHRHCQPNRKTLFPYEQFLQLLLFYFFSLSADWHNLLQMSDSFFSQPLKSEHTDIIHTLLTHSLQWWQVLQCQWKIHVHKSVLKFQKNVLLITLDLVIIKFRLFLQYQSNPGDCWQYKQGLVEARTFRDTNVPKYKQIGCRINPLKQKVATEEQKKTKRKSDWSHQSGK